MTNKDLKMIGKVMVYFSIFFSLLIFEEVQVFALFTLIFILSIILAQS